MLLQRTPMRRVVALAALVGCFLVACSAFDVFEPAGSSDVVIHYTGPDSLQVGDTAAITVAVLLAGAQVPAPRLRISISNPTVIELLSGLDSIVALKPGNTDLTIRLEHSIFVGEAPDTTVRLQVKQKRGPG